MKALIAFPTILLMGLFVPVGFICRAIQRGFQGGVNIFDASGDEILDDLDADDRQQAAWFRNPPEEPLH